MRGNSLGTITGLFRQWGLTAFDNGNIIVAENSSDFISVLNKMGKVATSFDGVL